MNTIEIFKEWICLDYPSESYICVFTTLYVLYVHGRKIKSFTSYADASNYWENEYCN